MTIVLKIDGNEQPVSGENVLERVAAIRGAFGVEAKDRFEVARVEAMTPKEQLELVLDLLDWKFGEVQ